MASPNQPTAHQDVNELLATLSSELGSILGDQLVGLYLTGSLTYGGFDRGSSDIDFLAVMSREMSDDERVQVADMHDRLAVDHPHWAKRIEGSYITENMLGCIEPPARARPYINVGAFWQPDPAYGNEWLINLFALQECGVALAGPEMSQLIPHVDIRNVRAASRRDLFEEWLPKLGEPAFFESDHHQAYVTLTVCRILHRAHHDGVVSKLIASSWVKQQYGVRWSGLIERAERWQHGTTMDSATDVMAFIRFAAACLRVN
jgi:hypothetical protein